MMKLTGVQQSATYMIVGLRGFSYERRLQVAGLFPVTYRRASGGILCTSCIIRGHLR